MRILLFIASGLALILFHIGLIYASIELFKEGDIPIIACTPIVLLIIIDLVIIYVISEFI